MTGRRAEIEYRYDLIVEGVTMDGTIGSFRGLDLSHNPIEYTDTVHDNP